VNVEELEKINSEHDEKAKEMPGCFNHSPARSGETAYTWSDYELDDNGKKVLNSYINPEAK
jgi:hypothetical protein